VKTRIIHDAIACDLPCDARKASGVSRDAQKGVSVCVMRCNSDLAGVRGCKNRFSRRIGPLLGSAIRQKNEHRERR